MHNKDKIESSNSASTEKPMASDSPESPHTCTHSSPDHGNAHFQSSPAVLAWDIFGASDLLFCVSVCAEVNKPKITDLSVSAVEELTQMAVEQEPLWQIDVDSGSWVLNDVEYKQRFGPLDPTLEEIIKMILMEGPIQLPNLSDNDSVLKSEASRETELVWMDPITLVTMFMDVDQWSIVFSSIISNASILAVLSTGQAGNPNGALHVMKAEFHVPSPLVRTRESYFARYWKQLASETWVVVDFSLESVCPSPVKKCQRKPSGCLIQGMRNGYSKVTWVEHVQIENTPVHTLFTPLVSSGFAFGAKRWAATLARHCDRLAAMMDNTDGKMSVLKLADRMMRGYYASLSASSESSWRPLPITGAEDILITASYNLDDPGTPRGGAVTVATSVWLPVPPNDVFNFLQDGNSRKRWDLLSCGRVTREMVRITTGRDPANCVKIVGVEAEPDMIMIFHLQECYTDSTGSYIVYAPIDIMAMNMILGGGNPDPDRVQMLASGFAVLPDRPTAHGEETGGSILTVSFKIIDFNLATLEYLPPNSVLTLYKLITETVTMIVDALLL